MLFRSHRESLHDRLLKVLPTALGGNLVLFLVVAEEVLAQVDSVVDVFESTLFAQIPRSSPSELSDLESVSAPTTSVKSTIISFRWLEAGLGWWTSPG